MVKVPVPAQPELPVSVQAPEIVFPWSVPVSVSVLPEGFAESTFMVNAPLV